MSSGCRRRRRRRRHAPDVEGSSKYIE